MLFDPIKKITFFSKWRRKTNKGFKKLKKYEKECIGYKEKSEVVQSVQKWTARFLAQAILKPLDALVAIELLKKYGSKGELLDVACGAGRMGAIVFYNSNFQGQIDGLDLEIELESNINEGNRRDIYRNFIFSNFDEMQTLINRYDIAFSNNGIIITPDLYKTLNSIHSVLKDEGLAIFNLCTPNYKVGYSKFYPELNHHPCYFSVEQIIDISKEAGFEVVEIRPYAGVEFADIYFEHFFTAYQELWIYTSRENSRFIQFWFDYIFKKNYLSKLKKSSRSLIAFAEAAEQNFDDATKFYVVLRRLK